MISTEEALASLFALAPPLPVETVPLAEATGRVLARDIVATRAQPPFAASAMDGYAVRRADLAPGAQFRVIGEAPAGRRFTGHVGAGEAVRIFTGAPVPDGADFILIQEDTEATSSGIRVFCQPGEAANIRPAGGDFMPGDKIPAPHRLRPADIALTAAMNVAAVTVSRRPRVAILPTGDELVAPGAIPRDDQIISSNPLGLKGVFELAGADVRMLPIASDTLASLQAAFALAEDSDLIVTTGGASVGDYDLIAQDASALGLKRSFYKVAMRPGKPLMAGHVNGTPLIGLPGNPVSSMVCGHVFIRPLLARLQGLPAEPLARTSLPSTEDLAANGPREHYMRARADARGITPFARQDSSLLRVLSSANALLIRPPHDPARPKGTAVPCILLDS